MRNTKKIVASLVAVGALAASGTAFTASNVMPSSTVAGYGTVAVTGAEVSGVAYERSADGSKIVKANLTLLGDQTARTIKVAFGAADLSDCLTPSFTTVTTVSCVVDTPVENTDTFHVSVS
jgi:hypothetical protein